MTGSQDQPWRKHNEGRHSGFAESQGTAIGTSAIHLVLLLLAPLVVGPLMIVLTVMVPVLMALATPLVDLLRWRVLALATQTVAVALLLWVCECTYNGLSDLRRTNDNDPPIAPK